MKIIGICDDAFRRCLVGWHDIIESVRTDCHTVHMSWRDLDEFWYYSTEMDWLMDMFGFECAHYYRGRVVGRSTKDKAWIEPAVIEFMRLDRASAGRVKRRAA